MLIHKYDPREDAAESMMVLSFNLCSTFILMVLTDQTSQRNYGCQHQLCFRRHEVSNEWELPIWHWCLPAFCRYFHLESASRMPFVGTMLYDIIRRLTQICCTVSSLSCYFLAHNVDHNIVWVCYTLCVIFPFGKQATVFWWKAIVLYLLSIRTVIRTEVATCGIF